MSNLKEQFDLLVNELVALGEDKEELGFWQAVFEKLSEDEKLKLVTLLQEEKATLVN